MDNLIYVPGLPAMIPPAGAGETRDYWTALAAEGWAEARYEADPYQAPLGYDPPEPLLMGSRWYGLRKPTGTLSERRLARERLDQEARVAARETAVVSRFQARAALYQAGLLAQVEALMAHPDTPELTRLAWTDAQEFKRLSPTVLAMSMALGLDDAALDALFASAALITA